jgi:hypothetical protein
MLIPRSRNEAFAGTFASYACLLAGSVPTKSRWDMPTSQSNSVLETWTHADLRGLILSGDSTRRFNSDAAG